MRSVTLNRQYNAMESSAATMAMTTTQYSRSSQFSSAVIVSIAAATAPPASAM